MTKKMFIKSSGNVFKDVGFNDTEAKNLKFRSHLMILLRKYILCREFSLKEAACGMGVSRSSIDNLMRGKLDLLNTDILFKMIERAGFPIYQETEKHIRQYKLQLEKSAIIQRRHRAS